VGYGSNCFMLEVADQQFPRTYKSTDGGATFTNVSFPVGASKVTPLIGTPGGTVIGVVKSAVTGSQPMLVRSTDGGTTWQGVRGSPTPLFQQTFSLTPASSCAVGTTLYVENLQSTDDGQTWTRRGVPNPIGSISGSWAVTTAFAIGGSLCAMLRWAAGTVAILASGAKSGIGMVPYNPGYFVKVA
jgi:photosystem II stability/assembly factor-like uncharacterized protein